VNFRRLLAEDEIKQAPKVRVRKPQVAEEVKPFFTDAELAPSDRAVCCYAD